jgi:uncharacterized protein HemX
VLAVIALVIACYALWRLDITLERLDRLGELTSRLAATQDALRTELSALTAQSSRAQSQLSQRLDRLAALPDQLERLEAALQELRTRSSGPQRAYIKNEVSFLLDAAQRSLTLDGDLTSAMVALESADARLATLLDPTLLPVRREIARELGILHAVSQPDLTTLQLRLASAEEQAVTAPIKGLVVLDSPRVDREVLPSGWWARGWALCRAAIATLVTVRAVDDAASRVVQPEEQLLRRQHLQLLLFSARQAVLRRDLTSYRTSLGGARQWLGEFFDLKQPAAEALLDEVANLEPINIAPRLPDISGSARLLRQMESQTP